MQYFSYTDKREVLHQEYSQPPILPSPHFRWVMNVRLLCCPRVEIGVAVGTHSGRMKLLRAALLSAAEIHPRCAEEHF